MFSSIHLDALHNDNDDSSSSEAESEENENQANVDEDEDEDTEIEEVEELVAALIDNASVSLPSNDALLFHRRHGTLITILNDGRTAERGNARDEFNNGVVMTNRLLRSNELFEVIQSNSKGNVVQFKKQNHNLTSLLREYYWFYRSPVRDYFQ